MRTLKNIVIKSFFSLFVLIGLNFVCKAQIKIGLNNEQINEGSLLELEHSSKGLMFSKVPILDIKVWGLDGDSPVNGMVVFNNASTNNPLGLYVWYNGQWNRLQSEISESTPLNNDRIVVFQNTPVSVNSDGLLLSNDPNWDNNDVFDDNVYQAGDHIVFTDETVGLYTTFVFDKPNNRWQQITPNLIDRSNSRSDKVYFSKDNGLTIEELDLDLVVISIDASSEVVFRKALFKVYAVDSNTGVKASQLKGVNQVSANKTIQGAFVFFYPASWSDFSYSIDTDLLGVVDVSNGLEYETVKAGGTSKNYNLFVAPEAEDYKAVTVLSNSQDVIIN